MYRFCTLELQIVSTVHVRYPSEFVPNSDQFLSGYRTIKQSQSFKKKPIEFRHFDFDQ